MHRTTWLILCLAVVANLILSGCAEPKPPTLAKDGGYVLTYQLTDEEHDISPAEMESRVLARLHGYAKLRGVEAKFADNELHVALPGINEQELQFCQQVMLIPGQLSLQIVADPQLDSIFFEESVDSDPLKITTPAGREAIWTPTLFPEDLEPELPTRTIDGDVHVLLLIQKGDISGPDFSRFRTTYDSQSGLALEFNLNEEGAQRMTRVTRLNRDRKLAIVFDLGIIAMPSIQGTISDTGIVTGRFTKDDIAKLIRIGELAKYGELPRLKLLSSKMVAPKSD